MDTTETDFRICYCMHVDRATLLAAIADGARTVADLQDVTGACTGCGTCRSELLELLASAGHETARPEAS